MFSSSTCRPARRAIACLILAALASTGAHADDNGDATNPQNAKQLGEVTVTGTTSALDLYGSNNASTGALGSRSVLDTPFSISTATSDWIVNQQAIDINEAFAADPAVTPLSTGYSGESAFFSVRGMPVDLLNGYKMDGLSIPNWSSDVPMEPFSEIQLLKGAGGFMYGFGAPGGILNYVSKQPTPQPYASFTLGYLSDGVYNESADLGGTFGGEGGWGYRLNLVHEDGDTFVDGSHIRRNAASLVLTKNITSTLHWHLDSIWQDRDMRGVSSNLILGQDYFGPGYLPENVSTPAPLDGSQRLSQPYTGYQTSFRVANTGLKWDISPDWSASVDYSYAGQTRSNHDSTIILLDNQGNYEDLNYLGYSRYSYQQWQGMLQGSFATGTVSHQLVLGVSWQAVDSNYPTDPLAYGQILGYGNIHDVPLLPDPGAPFEYGTYLAETTTQRAVFASDTLTFSPQWSALLGLRYSDFIDKEYDPGSAVPTARYEKTPLTPTVALLYKPNTSTTLYASYVEALEQSQSAPQGTANQYQIFAPTRSKQYEVGAKTAHDTWSVDLALFRVGRGLQYTNDDNVFVSDGRTRYQGIDLSGKLSLAQNWTLLGGVMYLDAYNQQAAEGVQGMRAYGTPRAQANLYVEYAVPQVAGLVLDAGGRYVGNEAIEADNAYFIGAYHTFDLGARYTTSVSGHAVTWRAGIDNLANEKYWLTSFGSNFNQGTPRTVRASVTLTL